MAKEESNVGKPVNSGSNSERLAKAKLSRAITSAALADLPDNVRAAYGIVNQAIKAAEGIKRKILKGNVPTGAELKACGDLIAQSAASMV